MGSLTVKTAAHDFLSFVNASPTPYHAVESMKARLTKAGFKEIKERDSWASTCAPGGKYLLTRNGSTLVAFAIGHKWKPGNPIAMIGAHTDSPCLRVKPVSKRSAEGYLQVGVETYGGGLWHTWFDRDLSVAGRVMVRHRDGAIVQKLVKLNKPILRIPTLAVHLDRQVPLEFNKETQLFPILGLVASELNKQAEQKTEEKDTDKTDVKSEVTPLKAVTQRHQSRLVELVAQEAQAQPEDIVDFELVLFDTQESCLGGLADEFIFSPRLDNLNSCYCATVGLIDSLRHSSALEEEASIRLMACFDHEEVGSTSAQGAASTMLAAILRRLTLLPSSHFTGSESSYVKDDDGEVSTAFEQSMAGSFLISADMSHAVNPNYAAKYESEHKPQMNNGPVIKVNANLRYATNSPGIVLLQEVARHAPKTIESDAQSVPLQIFVVRNDSSCGSTIGPMLSALLGARTLDLGNPQLSMHSIRETGGADDVHHAIRLFSSFYTNYSRLEGKILVD